MNILRRSLTTCSLGHVLQILNFFEVFLFLTHFENCLDTNQDPWMRRRVQNGKISSRARNTSLSRSFCRAPVLVSVSVRINIPPQGRTGILLQVERYSFPLYLGQFKKNAIWRSWRRGREREFCIVYKRYTDRYYIGSLSFIIGYQAGISLSHFSCGNLNGINKISMQIFIKTIGSV